MSVFDYNEAPPQYAGGDLIPDNTIVTVVATLRPGKAGPGGWLKTSGNNPKNNMADFEFTVEGGEFDRRKFWTLLSFADGEGMDTDGQIKSANSTKSTFRAMLESAHNVRPDDTSPEAQERRRAQQGYATFDGLKFCAKVAIEKGSLKNELTQEYYPDKNKLKSVVTPDQPGYVHPGKQSPNNNAPFVAGSVAAAPASQPVATAKPAWAS